MKGFLLSILAISGLIGLGSLGFAVAILYSLNSALNAFFMPVALSLDQLGNVWFAPLFNLVLRKKGGYEFGDPDQTISYVIGRNKLDGTLTAFGRLIYRGLNKIEENHCEIAVKREEGE